METTLNIITEKLNSANIAVKSEGMADYEIKADINVSGSKVSNINNGFVTRLSDKKALALFNLMGMSMDDNHNLTVTYMVSDITLQCEINRLIGEFVTAIKVTPTQYINYQS